MGGLVEGRAQSREVPEHVGADVGDHALTDPIDAIEARGGGDGEDEADAEQRDEIFVDKAGLEQLISAESVKGLVIGLPLNLDGTDSPRTQSVRAFARNLEPLGLPILLWDERWSTQAVTRTLIDADASRARRASLVDKMAAAYILQGAIDALTMAG